MTAALRAALLMTACAVATPALAQTSRDIPPRNLVTGAIAGVVMSDERPFRPLRRVRVVLTGAELTSGRTTITADDGTFAFDRLPPDEYRVKASKDGYVPNSWGAARAGRPGLAIAIHRGGTQRITIRLPRGSVITGRVADAQGEPVAGVQVEILADRFAPWTGGRWLERFGLPTETDDRGVYRVFGLPAGDYLVAAHAFPALARDTVLQVLSPQEVRRALAELEVVRTQAQPGPPRSPPAPAAVPNEPRRRVGLAPVFYPGTVVQAQAATVRVAAGEERTGVDFDLQYVPTATVSGSVPLRAGGPTPLIALIPQAEVIGPDRVSMHPAAEDGSFAFTGVPPGRYTVLARGPSQIPGSTATATWGATEIIVDGDDITGLALPLQPGLTIAGQVRFVGTPPRRPPSQRFQLPVVPTLRAPFDIEPSGRVDADGRFRIEGVVPGGYRLQGGKGIRAPVGDQWLRSVVINGRDLLDAPIELRQSADDAVVTWSDQASDITGTVTDARGAPLAGRTVILFATDRTAWFFNSRRIAAGRTNALGRYRIRNLPPGEYYAVAAADVGENEWFDPSLLDRAARLATTIRLEAEERKVVDLSSR